MIYELRIYDAVPGRLPDLHARFTNVTLRCSRSMASPSSAFGKM